MRVCKTCTSSFICIFKDFMRYILDKLIIFLTIIRYKLWRFPINDDGIIDSVVLDNHETLTINGWKPLSSVHLKAVHDIVEVGAGEYTVSGSVNHLVYSSSKSALESYQPTKVKDLSLGDILMTMDGARKVSSIQKSHQQIVFDLSVVDETLSYFSDGILSHNSVMSGIFIAWYILTNYDKTVLCTSANADKVDELVDKINSIFMHLPFYMKLGIEVDNVSKKKWDNGCKLIGETATENSGAGETADLLYADEFALIEPNIINEFFRVVYPTLSASKKSKMIITSTARGMNKFYQLYQDALDGKNNFNPIRIDWWEVEGRDEQWRLDQIADLGSEADFNQEYGNSFMSGSTLLLSTAVLKKLGKYQKKFVNGVFSNDGHV